MYNFDSLIGKTQTEKINRPLFIGGYMPSAPLGTTQGFNINTMYIQPDRKSELVGPVPVRSHDSPN